MIATLWRPAITWYFVRDSSPLSQSLLNFFTLRPQFYHQSPNWFICYLLCLINIWGPFGSSPGDIWLPDPALPENPLSCWIHLLIWDSSLGVLLETCLACVGKLCPVFPARGRCRVAEDYGKCVSDGPFSWTSHYRMAMGRCAHGKFPHSRAFIYQELNNLCIVGFH